tara:strand:+ start:350 stop:646 length:297 start_codon:yes stop_codon:yes gene_type:complete
MSDLTNEQQDYVNRARAKVLKLEDDYLAEYCEADDKGSYSKFTRTWSLGASQIRRKFVRNVVAIFEIAMELHQIDLTQHGMLKPEEQKDAGPFAGEGV